MKELRQIVKDASMASAGVTLATTTMTPSPASPTYDVDKSIEKLKDLFEKQQKDFLGASEKVIT